MKRRPIDPPIDYWNYRVRRRTYKHGPPINEAEAVLDVIEVYYDERGAILFWSEPQTTESDTLDDLRGELGHMIAATTKPIIEHEDLPGT